jgi:hypothetical protein
MEQYGFDHLLFLAMTPASQFLMAISNNLVLFLVELE